jgi:predicted GNAT family acetyltransferase
MPAAVGEDAVDHDQLMRSELEALEGAYLLTEACAAYEIADEDRNVAISWAQSEIARRVKRYMRERAELTERPDRPPASDGVVLAAMRLNAAWLSADVDGLRRRGRELRKRMDELTGDDFPRAAAARAGAVLRLAEVTARSSAGMMGEHGFGRRRAGEQSVTKQPEARVVRLDDLERFELLVGDGRAGKMDYKLDSETIVLLHTDISPEFEGQGLGGRLARAALDFARTESLNVLPLCPFVTEYIRRHPEYQDLTPG